MYLLINNPQNATLLCLLLCHAFSQIGYTSIVIPHPQLLMRGEQQVTAIRTVILEPSEPFHDVPALVDDLQLVIRVSDHQVLTQQLQHKRD